LIIAFENDASKCVETFCYTISTIIGFHLSANDLFQSYLTGRKQFVEINRYHSTMKSVQFSVPQDSNLGLVLFLIYVNDLFNNFNTTRCYLQKTCLIALRLKQQQSMNQTTY